MTATHVVHMYFRQKWLAVIDLKETTKVKTDRKLGRSSKYEVKAVQWNPHHANKDLLVSTVSSLLVSCSVQHCTHYHYRVSRNLRYGMSLLRGIL